MRYVLHHPMQDISISMKLAPPRLQGLWYWIHKEWVFRSPFGETILHMVVRQGQLITMRALMSDWVNPFLVDRQGHTPIDLAVPRSAIWAELQRYMTQAPCRQVMDWYGPLVIARARTFLLVMHRWRRTGHHAVPPRDVIVHLIIGHLRAIEYK